MTELQIARKQNKDLRIRLSNEKSKREADRIETACQTKILKDAIQGKDKLIASMQKAAIVTDGEISKLKLVNDALKHEIEKLAEENAGLRRMQKKDCTTSDKPPSSDPFRKPRISPERQKKSGMKPGGQPGHTGHGLLPFPNPTEIVDRWPQERCECGGLIRRSEDYAAKQNADLHVEVKITEERAHKGCCADCGKIHWGKFPQGYVNPVRYGSGLKATVATLGSHANVPMKKTAEIISSVTNSLVNISAGTVANINQELAGKLSRTVDAIRTCLIAGDVLNADETGCRVGGGLDWQQIFSNGECVLFGHNEKRGGLMAEDFDLLILFTGTLVHDHFKAYYKYTNMTHAECNSHILRYLLAIVTILGHDWAQKLSELLTETNKRKREAICNGETAFSAEDLERIKKSYLEILDEGDVQYKTAIDGKKCITYYNEEKCLLARLREYAEQHLLFIFDFSVPFTNNGAEHGARFLKSKMKVIGCFRSVRGAVAYARIASFIETAKKQHVNVWGAIKNIFDGIDPDFVDDWLADAA